MMIEVDSRYIVIDHKDTPVAKFDLGSSQLIDIPESCEVREVDSSDMDVNTDPSVLTDVDKRRLGLY
jgi:hypothetical protein